MNTSFSAHTLCDLRNHLTAVILLTEELLDEGGLKKERQKALLDVRNELFAMKKLLVPKDSEQGEGE